MSETCAAQIQNQSGRPFDAIIMWHTSGPPTPADLTPANALIQASNVPAGDQLQATAQLTDFSPTDYWTCGVRFQGDGENYYLCGVTGDPYKEYEVSDGSTITFIFNEYSPNTANQNDVTIRYSGDDGGMAFLLNQTTVILVDLGAAIAQALGDMAG